MDCNENEQKARGPLLGMRHLQVALIFLNCVVLYITRIHVAITLVAMTNAEKSNPDFPEYEWNEQEKSYILSSFFWGYVLSQLPGAYLVRRFGVKICLTICTTIMGLLNLLVPWCLTWGDWEAFCLIRFIQGLLQGVLAPAVLQHMAIWSPLEERSLLCGLALSGFDFGIVAAMAFSGMISTSSMGWPGTFYIYAGISLLWCALWQIFGANDASHTKFITKNEQFYIEQSLRDSVDSQENRPPVPWRAMFTSKSFYAVVIARTANEAGIVTLQSEWPTYINGVLKFNMENNSLYSTLPYIASWILGCILSLIANFIIRRNWLSLTAARKFFNACGMTVPAIGVVAIAFLDETQKDLAIITMTLVIALNSSTNMGNMVCLLEIAPNHSETVISIANTSGFFAVLLGTLYFGAVVNNEEDRFQWRIGFLTLAAVFCIGDLVFLICGTAKQQAWNAIDYIKRKNSIEQTKL